MTDRDSDAQQRHDPPRTTRLWARGLQTVFAGGPEMVRLNGETMRFTMAPYTRPERSDRTVADIAPHGAIDREPEPSPIPSDDPFDAFLEGFEPDLPLTH